MMLMSGRSTLEPPKKKCRRIADCQVEAEFHGDYARRPGAAKGRKAGCISNTTQLSEVLDPKGEGTRRRH